MHPDTARQVKRLGLLKELTWGMAAAIMALAAMDSAWPQVLHLPRTDHFGLDEGSYVLGLLCMWLASMCHAKSMVLQGRARYVVSPTAAVLIGISGTALLLTLLWVFSF